MYRAGLCFSDTSRSLAPRHRRDRRFLETRCAGDRAGIRMNPATGGRPAQSAERTCTDDPNAARTAHASNLLTWNSRLERPAGGKRRASLHANRFARRLLPSRSIEARPVCAVRSPPRCSGTAVGLDAEIVSRSIAAHHRIAGSRLPPRRRALAGLAIRRQSGRRAPTALALLRPAALAQMARSSHFGASPNSPTSHRTKPPIARMAISPAMRSRRTTHVD